MRARRWRIATATTAAAAQAAAPRISAKRGAESPTGPPDDGLRLRRQGPHLRYQAGGVGVVPFAMGHYIQNTGDETLTFLEMVRSDHYADVSLSHWMGVLSPELVKARPTQRWRRHRQCVMLPTIAIAPRAFGSRP